MYSQYHEDDLIIRELADMKQPGRLLDIGAWDPKIFSNSRALIQHGWSAVLVEPSPEPLKNLIKEYSNRADVRVVSGLVVPDETYPLVRMHITDDATSTSNEANYDLWKGTCNFLGDMWAAAIPVSRLIPWGPYEFVNIDAEGDSVQIAIAYLQQLAKRPGLLPRVLPRVMCVEYDKQLAEVVEFAGKYGFGVIHMNGTNVILRRGE